jgi:hypothetical protein
MLKKRRFSLNSGRVWLLMGCIAAFLMICGACSNNKIPDIYIPGPVSAGSSLSDVSLQQPVNIHYFFKRNRSMAGYVIENMETGYMKTLRAIYQTGDSIERNAPGSNSTFYEYGTLSIDSLPDKSSIVEDWMIPNRNIDKPLSNGKYDVYYEFGAVNRRTEIQKSKGRPFGTVSDYIFNDLLKENGEENCLYIIVSNLLEQSKDIAVFSSFYERAFKAGLSGAFFAVDSAFKGEVFSFILGKLDDDERSFDKITNDSGKATFFILIAGSRNEVSFYTDRLSRILTSQEIAHDNVVFMVGSEKTVVWTPDAVPERPDEKDLDNYLYSVVNLQTDKLPNFYQGKVNPNNESDKADATIYRLDWQGSRYFAGLEINNFNQACYVYPIKLSANYSGEQPVTENGITKFSELRDISGLFKKYEILFKDDIPDINQPHPVFISMEMVHSNFNRGVYHVRYGIIPKPIVPVWIKERNVPNFTRLAESVKNDSHVKVENLEFIYQGIIDAYESVGEREKYMVDFYLVKRN